MTEHVETALADADVLVDEDRWFDAIEMLTERNREQASPAIERRLVELRHLAFDEVAFPGAAPAAKPVDPEPCEGIPEVDAADVDAGLIAGALRTKGALFVRGFMDRARTAALRDAIDGAFVGRGRIHAGEPLAEAEDFYHRFTPRERYPFGWVERSFADFGSGVLGVDAPRALFEVIEAMYEAGVRDTFTDYFGEPPAFSVKKTTMRRTQPDTVAGWHQDGAFLGVDTKALNVWTALTPAGVDAPGLEVLVRSLDDLVPTGGEGIYDWSVSDETASRYPAEEMVRPRFDEGDALIFDHMTLHRTGVDPSMTKTRYAVEMWFFAPSTYPAEQIPVCL